MNFLSPKKTHTHILVETKMIFLNSTTIYVEDDFNCLRGKHGIGEVATYETTCLKLELDNTYLDTYVKIVKCSSDI